jgi:hypothetical protein
MGVEIARKPVSKTVLFATPREAAISAKVWAGIAGAQLVS